jgi:DnaK suppressor protein
MKKAQADYFRNRLVSWENELLCQADHTISVLLGSPVGSADVVDQAVLTTHRDLSLRIRDRESKLIRKIRAALRRIEDGTFGICEMCGEEIGLGRLRARPVTTLCIDCKRVCETLEKSIGI